MIREWEVTYLLLLNELHLAKKETVAGINYAESGFAIAIKYWHLIRQRFNEEKALTDAGEIGFFRNIKPRFTCLAEYFLLVNKSFLFIPDAKRHQKEYWEEELQYCPRFIKQHRNFIAYYESASNELDQEYFLRRHSQSELPVREMIYADDDCRSSHDHLIRGLLAAKMYHDFVSFRSKV